MGALDKLADKMYGRKRLEVTASLASVATDTYIGTAVSDSEDGNVQVIVSDDVTQPDHWQEFVTYGNLSPFLSHDLTDYGAESSDAYWNNAQEVVAALGSATQTEDGWAHFAGTASDMALAINAAQLEVEDGQEYTLLVELRNIAQAPNGSSAIELSDSEAAQIRGDGTEYQYADGIIRLVGKGNASAVSGVHLALCSGNSASYDFDLRLSLYTGAYEGGYFPYGEQEITQADLGTAINIPSTVAVKAGDKVLVTASGAEVITPMVVTGVVGRGDIQQSQIDDAQQKADSVQGIAQQALDVAEATGQHFWHDDDGIHDDGIHVTEVTEEEWKDSSGQHYHSGMNVLINSLGQLFRNGLNNLMALLPSPDEFTPSRIAFYDGKGNAEENIIALIEPDEVQLVRQVSDVAVSTGSVSLLGDKVYVSGQNNPSTGETVGRLVTVNNTRQNWNTYGATISKTREGSSSSYDWATCEQALRAYIHDGQNAVYSEMGVSSGAGMFTTTNAFIRSPVLDLSTSAAGEAGTVDYAVEMLEVINTFRTASKTMNLSNVGNGTHTLNLYRQGHFVYASMTNAINPASANTAINAGTVPSGYRPAAYAMCSGNGMVSNTIGGWYYRWRVAPTGAIVLHISVTGAREAPLVMCWFTNDAWPTS